jgi:hypothetical protein
MKHKAISKVLHTHDVEVCFLLETKMPTCTNSMIYKIWNGKEVKWWTLDSEGRSGGMLALWDKSKFNAHIVEYVSGWIALYGKHMATKSNCDVVGVYAHCSIQVWRCLRRDLTILKAAFDVPWFMIGDFNETLEREEHRSKLLNIVGPNSLKMFLETCDLHEFPLVGQRFIWFRGGSMSRIVRAFASPIFHMMFAGLLLQYQPRRLSDHCQLLLARVSRARYRLETISVFGLLVISSAVSGYSDIVVGSCCLQFLGHYMLLKSCGKLLSSVSRTLHVA